MTNYSNLQVAIALFIFFSSAVLLISCDSKYPAEPFEAKELRGQSGELRFQLQYSNSDLADLELHVQGPDGEILFFGNTESGTGGTMDLLCGLNFCQHAGIENIYWQKGRALNGTYRYWVSYYEAPNGNAAQKAPSSYILFVLVDDEVVAKQTGTLQGGNSETFRFEYEQGVQSPI